MTLNQLENQIHNYLIQQKVESPNRRMSDFKKIREFMEKTGSFLKDNEVVLNLERKDFKSQYLKYKKSTGGSENLNGAENHVIKLIYDYCDN